MGQPSNRTIVGVAILLFTAVLMGVGIHHLISTGTCSSTGYAANYGPVPYCPSGTGWWMAFLFIGIIGGIVGGVIAGASTVGLINGSIFTAIGVGSFTVVFDKQASSKTFAAVFGGCFAVVGGIILMFVLASVFRSARGSSRTARGARTGLKPIGSRTTSAFGTPQTAGPGSSTSSAFGTPSKDVDPILGAYAAGHSGGAEAGLSGTGLPSSSVAGSGLGSGSGGVGVATPPSPGGDAGSDLDSLSKLADLHQAGALTDDEFAREKAKLLGS